MKNMLLASALAILVGLILKATAVEVVILYAIAYLVFTVADIKNK